MFGQLDAGMYSGRDGIAALPYFDEFDLSTIDVLLISQYVPLHSPSISIYKSFLSTTEIVVLWIREKVADEQILQCIRSRYLLFDHVSIHSCISLDEPQYNDFQILVRLDMLCLDCLHITSRVVSAMGPRLPCAATMQS